MKRVLAIVALLLALSLVMSSCKKKAPTEPEEVFTGEMSADVAGILWETDNPIYYNTIDMVAGAQLANGIENISDFNTITIHLQEIDDSLQVRSYNALCFYQESRGEVPNTIVNTWDDYHGICEITEVTDERVKGTFSFKGTNREDNTTKVVTGKFFAPRK